MHTPLQYLRMYRKRSPLLQSDVAYIMGLQEYSSISRWETGEREPCTDFLLTYHLLFEMPVETLFEREVLGYTEPFLERVYSLVNHLLPRSGNDKVARRIQYLNGVVTRLTKVENE